MQLSHHDDSYETASVNLKALLLLFAVVLVGVLGYLVYQQNHTVTDSSGGVLVHPKATTLPVVNLKK